MLDTREGQRRRNRRPSAKHRRMRPGPGHILRAVWSQAVVLLCVAGSILLWTVGFAGTDPREMGELGLLSQFNSATVAAMVLLLGSTLICVFQHRPGWVVGTHLVTYLVLLHGTPAVLYGSVRYAWSFKHLGMVDFILRTGQVDPGIDVNPIYHNWPGMFAASALIADLGGQGAADAMALWAPLGFNLILLVVLRYLFRGMTGRTPVVWLALVIYFTMTWVGQDYFSPQAVAYILYLGVMGLLVRHRHASTPRTLVFLLLVAAMTVTHQITLVILLLAVGALLISRQVRGWHLLISAVGIISAWALTFAGDYTLSNFEDLLSGLGQPLSNAEATLGKSDGTTGVQRLVVWGDRFTVAAGLVFALLGIRRGRRSGTLSWTPVILMLAPAVILLQMSFGGEALLRVFLFSAPFMAFLAAGYCAPRDGAGPVDTSRLRVAALVIALLFPGFLLGYYGKERYNYFTDQEIAAARWVAVNALPGSLLVEGDVNYPRQLLDSEKFTYVPIAYEPSVERVLANPEDTLHQWLANPRFADGYVVITRSQKLGVELDGSLPPGSLTEVEEALTGSALFTVVFSSPDATVFTLSELGRR